MPATLTEVCGLLGFLNNRRNMLLHKEIAIKISMRKRPALKHVVWVITSRAAVRTPASTGSINTLSYDKENLLCQGLFQL